MNTQKEKTSHRCCYLFFHCVIVKMSKNEKPKIRENENNLGDANFSISTISWKNIKRLLKAWKNVAAKCILSSSYLSLSSFRSHM
jgi:hypothetical protein